MIRKINNLISEELAIILEIWLDSNIETHKFISTDYWKENYDDVKEQLPQAELFLFEEAGIIKGFMGLSGNYIAGIFIKAEYRKQGIGTRLLEQGKGEKAELALSVYQKNSDAYKFYLSQGFVTIKENIDSETNEVEYQMQWAKE